jgi:hypothetical protein
MTVNPIHIYDCNGLGRRVRLCDLVAPILEVVHKVESKKALETQALQQAVRPRM